MKNITFLLLILTISTSEKPLRTITGIVYDENGNTLVGVLVREKGTTNGTVTKHNGTYSISITDEESILEFSFVGFQTQSKKVGSRNEINAILKEDLQELQEVVVVGYGNSQNEDLSFRPAPSRSDSKRAKKGLSRNASYSHNLSGSAIHNDYMVDLMTEEYDGIEENIFHRPTDKPLSTFSIDVDVASYSNMRRFLNLGQSPPKDAVRIEEMINYFNYDYEQPDTDQPFSIHTSYAPAPWNSKHLVAHIGLQGKRIATEELPASNLVFLIDVSGSMNAPNKLPLLKSSMMMLVNEMRADDQISIVVYAGAAGLVLPPTSGHNKQAIIGALEKLEAGGSTAGGAGINLAYKVASEQFIKGGNNRIILATDGDFNVGSSSNAEMQRLIESKRDQGVFLTVLGFGMGNYKDSKMEVLADKGNGNYAYIDNIQEAKKVLVSEFGGTLFTIAKDVKLQVEFNPTEVQAYRLIGYENRMLNDEDFNDDSKDAGELGSGHTVTALYEIIPSGIQSKFIGTVDPLKYQNHSFASSEVNGELLTVKFRYKQPDANKSKMIVTTLDRDALDHEDQNLRWAASVAGFGMLLRDSEFKGTLTYDQVLTLATSAMGTDDYGYRKEFIGLVEVAGKIQ